MLTCDLTDVHRRDSVADALAHTGKEAGEVEVFGRGGGEGERGGGGVGEGGEADGVEAPEAVHEVPAGDGAKEVPDVHEGHHPGYVALLDLDRDLPRPELGQHHRDP